MHPQVEDLIQYMKEKYNAFVEQPWAKYPENITFKDPDVMKWFALIMPVERNKVAPLWNRDVSESSDQVYIINVKAEQYFIGMISQNYGYMPGYHMNKQHWLTILVDGTVPTEQILDRIDDSYELITNTPTKRIYQAVKQIPKGKVATYSQVAEMAGNPKMSRAVGNALHKNPNPEQIPCHRVVNAKGELADAFVFGGKNVQKERLIAEGVEVQDNIVDLKKYGIWGHYI